MTIDDAARSYVAVARGNRLEAIYMVAIAGPESSYRSNACNDDLSQLSPALQQAARVYSCEGCFAVGYWQVFLPVWFPELQDQFGWSTLCVARSFLFVGSVNARVAKIIYERQGFNAWVAWSGGQWRAYEAQATAAVDRVMEGAELSPIRAIEPPARRYDPTSLRRHEPPPRRFRVD